MSKAMQRVLVVGGAGYVGSHVCKALSAGGMEPIVFDSLVYGHRRAVKWGPLVVGDIGDAAALDGAFATHRPDGVIHLAAFAYVGESVIEPAKYYVNNVGGTMSLLAAMRRANVDHLVFSSTAAVYGVPASVPISEDAPLQPINPYGRSKVMVEQILADHHSAYGTSYAALRYFNACGADPDGELGEWHDPETHLIPRALMAVHGKLPHLELFGQDYPTPDGTCIRDYVHVSDLAVGHVQALCHLAEHRGALRLNLGTGTGASVNEVLSAVERVIGRPVPVVREARRDGDPPSLVADPTRARRELGFTTRYSDLETIIRTASPLFDG